MFTSSLLFYKCLELLHTLHRDVDTHRLISRVAQDTEQARSVAVSALFLSCKMSVTLAKLVTRHHTDYVIEALEEFNSQLLSCKTA